MSILDRIKISVPSIRWHTIKISKHVRSTVGCITVNASTVCLRGATIRHGLRLLHPNTVLVEKSTNTTVIDSVIDQCCIEHGSVMLRDSSAKACYVRMHSWESIAFDNCAIDTLTVYGTLQPIYSWIALRNCSVRSLILHSNVVLSIEDSDITQMEGDATIVRYHLNNCKLGWYSQGIHMRPGIEDDQDLAVMARHSMDTKYP